MQWYPEIEEIVPSAVKVFVGNKIDLREQHQKQSTDPKKAPIVKETARKIIEDEMKCKYFECSALTQEGLKEIFDESVRAVLRKKQRTTSKNSSSEESGCKACQLI